MLPKENRLTRSRDFDRLYRKGQRIKIGELLIFYQPNRFSVTRLGFVVSKKVAAKASRRNYLKRVLRAAFAALPSSLKISYDMIVSITRDPATLNPAKKPFTSFQTAALELESKLK
jgi:ribonuclease P protein component